MSKLALVKQNNIGYKINSHYRIGSELHITHFYYTKRFFQNSFFSSKMAFITANAIAEKIKGHDDFNVIKTKGISLVGYGVYSELFMSLVEKFLLKKLSFAESLINHNTLERKDKLELIKAKQSIFPYAVIIVPIASTFSTAIKIEEFLTENKPSIKIIEPHFNIIHVRDSGYTDTCSALEQQFGWSIPEDKKNDNEIDVKYFNLKGKRKQRYFISLPTEWKSTIECDNCFPEDAQKRELPLMEEVIYDTDKSSITPNIIFDYPKGRVPEHDIPFAEKFEVVSAMVKYGHHVRNNDHFFYSIDTELFFKSNIISITDWLKQVKHHLLALKENPLTKDENILIIASCHHTNAAFISLIYEKVFASAANIIHYDPENDYLQNFATLYQRDIEKARKIFFVDDALKSGKTFSRISDFVRYACSYKKDGLNSSRQKKFFSAFFLINKSQEHVHEMVKGTLDSACIYSFAHLNLSSSYTPDNETIVHGVINKYTSMLKECHLSSIQDYFQNYFKKFVREKGQEIADKQKEEHLDFIEATHRLYQVFGKQDFINSFPSLDFKDFLDSLIKITNCPFETGSGSKSSIRNIPRLGIAVLKVLTLPPFLQFQPLRKKVFKWVMEIMDNLVDELSVSVQSGKLRVTDLEGFRFIIRRACALQSNYLVSTKMLACIKLLYSPGGFPLLLYRKSTQADPMELEKSAKNRIIDFSIYYCAQLKELFFQNPASAIKFEKRAWKLLHNKTGNSKGFEHFVRLNLLENSGIIQNYVKYIVAHSSWEQALIMDKENKELSDGADANNKLIELLGKPSVINHSSHKLSTAFFDVLNQHDLARKFIFPVYLWIKNFIDFKGADTKLTLKEKTEFIFEKIKDLMSAQVTEEEGINYVGTFLMVNDLAREPFLVYDLDYDGRHMLQAEKWKTSANQLILDSLGGKLQTPQSKRRTIIELEKVDTGWTNAYLTGMADAGIVLDAEFLPAQYNKLIILRLNKWEKGEEETTLGIIGIYFVSNTKWNYRFNRIRFLLLLKDALSSFIEKHHQNNEFTDFLIAENSRRLGLLAGHGREMLQKLALNRDHKEFFSPIVFNLLYLQKLVILKDEANRKKSSLDGLGAKYGLDRIKEKHPIYDGYKMKIEKLIEIIFASPDIETAVTVKPRVQVNIGNIGFKYNEDILNLIFFELILNAKKNRWHFIKDLDGDGKPEEINGISENEVIITISVTGNPGARVMDIRMKNTGPHVPVHYYDEWDKDFGNPKGGDEIAGTLLLKKLIIEFLGDRIDFVPNLVNIQSGSDLSYFIVNMKLKEMD